jgi:hypothetical protein
VQDKSCPQHGEATLRGPVRLINLSQELCGERPQAFVLSSKNDPNGTNFSYAISLVGAAYREAPRNFGPSLSWLQL